MDGTRSVGAPCAHISARWHGLSRPDYGRTVRPAGAPDRPSRQRSGSHEYPATPDRRHGLTDAAESAEHHRCAASGLGLSVTTHQLGVTPYKLAFAGLLLLGRRVAYRLGARGTLMIGVGGYRGRL